ncbi:ATP-binding protein [uncultured Croceitalea sp.]|uniref:tetratricopeptide repeat-containing sensor histidine kinase n=1 Tax=uncultured Croceitalea sp. TaxID=1798908 RepID=UPI00374F2E2B
MIYTRKTKVLFSTFLLLVFLQPKLYSQESVRFQAYGYTPNTVSDSLYALLNNSSDVNEKLNTLHLIANEYLKYGNADSIVHYAQLIKTLCNSKRGEINNVVLYETKAHRILGQGKFLNGLFDEALKTYIQGIDKAKLLDNPSELNRIKLGLGQVYLRKQEYEKANPIFMELTLFKNENNVSAKSNFYLGTIAFEKNNLALAKEYFNKAASESVNQNEPKFQLWIQLYQGRLSAELNKNDIAFDIYEKIMTTSLNSNYFDIYTEAVLEYGNICTKLKQYQIAEMALSMAYTNAIQWNRLELQKKIINSLRLTYQAKGDFENAYNLMTQHQAISNQIIEQQNSKAIKEIEIKYQTLQKENEIYELKEVQRTKQSELEQQKTIKKAFLYGFLVLLIPIIALLYVYYQKLQTQSQLNKQQEELNSQKIAALLNSQELELARTSLDAQQEERHRIAKQLHDSIGSNLAGIKLQLANLKSSSNFQKEVMNQVNETYELVRDISHDLVPKKFNQNTFTFLLEKYIGQLQKNSTIEITFSAHPKEKINRLPERLKVELYQITQELFTNTLKHANASAVEIHLNIHDEMFQLIFEDDGNGFDSEKFRKGIGLQNIESRLQQLEATLMLDSAPTRGTVITIEIPLKD